MRLRRAGTCWGCRVSRDANQIIRSIAHVAFALVMVLLFAIVMAGLTGCNATRQWPGAQAAKPAPAPMQAASCRAWDERA